MKIALIYDRLYPSSVGGAEIRYYELARELGSHHEITLYGDDAWLKTPTAALPGCRAVAIMPSYKGTARRNAFSAIKYAVRLFRALRRSDADLWDVLSFPYFHVPFCWLLARLQKKIFVVTWVEYWGDFWKEALPPGAAQLGFWVEKLAIRCSPWLLAISEHTRDRLIAAGAPPDRVLLVQCGTHVSAIASLPDSPHSQLESGLISIGRLIPHKNFDLVLKAMAHLPEMMKLTLIGDGPEAERLKLLARELGLEHRVHFVGFLASHQEVLSRIKHSRVLVQPSSREGFGHTLIEAWAAGVPVVTCRGPFTASASLITNPCLGEAVDEFSPELIAQACLRQWQLSSESTLQEQRRTHAQSFDWPLIAKSAEGAYQKAFSERPKA